MGEEYLLIGEFSARSRLSVKALRLYDDLGLLVPARVDPGSGYRWYAPAQLARARQVALLRALDMPLAAIAEVLALPPGDAADRVRRFWSGRESDLERLRGVAAHLCGLIEGRNDEMTRDFTVTVQEFPERAVLSAVRYVHLADAGQVLGSLLGRMAASGPGRSGLSGCPFSIYHAAVSADSDGPVEMVRPMADLAAAHAAAARLGDVQARTDPAHEEAVVPLTLAQAAWPAELAALDAVEDHLRGIGRTPSGPPRQIMIADWRTATSDTVACLLGVPLRP